MRSIGLNSTMNLNTIPNATTTTSAEVNNETQQENVQNPNNNQPAAPVNNNNIDPDIRAEEREDDWLSLLHNLCSFLVLFSIVYFYSTLTRFLIVLVAVLLLML
jgi:hypothetical protein